VPFITINNKILGYDFKKIEKNGEYTGLKTKPLE